MKKRSSVLAVLAAGAVLAVPVSASAASASSDSSTSRARTLSFRGMNFHIPADWRVYRHGDGLVVATGASCKKPEPFAPNCEGFWIFGPKAYTNVPVGGGSITYTGKYQFHPFSGVMPCPFNSKLSWYPGEKASFRGLRQVGSGHKAQYTTWPNRCVTNGSGRTTSKWTQREWFLPTSKILVVDVWNTYGLSGVLKHATWN
ncbi:hypothetical protein [Sphaerisporangium fuscum]|uniref:hypothetical protein n=1 Tax=Sphaerisporangium fuscum TaxID=2835868 RepID=UPI001BDD1887|nr:hypothetical protein [Sphaerisporangium fuscum]